MGIFGIFNILRKKGTDHVSYIERERLENIYNAKVFLYDLVFKKAVEDIKESYIGNQSCSAVYIPSNIEYPQLSCLDYSTVHIVALEAVNDVVRSLQIKASKIERRDRRISITLDYGK